MSTFIHAQHISRHTHDTHDTHDTLDTHDTHDTHAATKPKLRPKRGTQDLGVEPRWHIPQRNAVFIALFVHLSSSVLQCVAAMNRWVVSMTLGVQQCRGVTLFGVACKSD